MSSKNPKIKSVSPSGPSIAERYFTFLTTPYRREDGTTALPASGRYVDVLREVQDAHVPRINLSACLAGTEPGFRGKVWFWSDTHFSHANIIKYCNRPWPDAQAMNGALLRSCLARVSSGDILVFGGDIAMRDRATANALLRAIPAYKINVLGNHDIEKRELLKYDVDEVCACLELTYKGTSYFLSHQPVNTSFLAPGQVSLHGHIHDSVLSEALGDGSRHINISVEHTEYAPATLDWLLARHQASALHRASLMGASDASS